MDSTTNSKRSSKKNPIRNCLRSSSTQRLCNQFSNLQFDNASNDEKNKQTAAKKKNRQILNRSKSESGLKNTQITDYFQVRKSQRSESKNNIWKKEEELQNKIINKVKDGLKIEDFKDKGRGIVTTKKFFKGDYVIEYIGDLIDKSTADKREAKYAKNNKIGCYMYYFKHKDVQWCVDATKESGELGRLINHSRKGNLISKIIEVKTVPRIIFFAKEDISIGTELLYDYGDRRTESVKHHPWLIL